MDGSNEFVGYIWIESYLSFISDNCPHHNRSQIFAVREVPIRHPSALVFSFFSGFLYFPLGYFPDFFRKLPSRRLLYDSDFSSVANDHYNTACVLHLFCHIILTGFDQIIFLRIFIKISKFSNLICPRLLDWCHF